LLLSFKKEESSFLKKRGKRLLFSRADFTARFRTEAWSQAVRLIGRGEQLQKSFALFFRKKTLSLQSARPPAAPIALLQ
jgi:hypothetical protein